MLQDFIHSRDYTGGILQRLDTDMHSAVTAMVRIVMLQRWQWQRWNISGYDTDVTATFTLVWQRWQLTLLWQWCAHRCHTNVNIAVTLMRTSLSQRCQCHRCCSAVSCHRCHTSVHSNVTALSLSSLLHRCQLHRWHTNVAAIAVTVLSLPLMLH